MDIMEIIDDKKAYIDLLLLGDEQEDMIDKYLNIGKMFVLLDKGAVIGQCVVTNEGQGVYEVKSISVSVAYQRQGYGRVLLDYVYNYFGDLNTLYIGTGDSEKTIAFYEACGFVKSHIVENFFTDNYNHEIVEDGHILKDMVYLRRSK